MRKKMKDKAAKFFKAARRAAAAGLAACLLCAGGASAGAATLKDVFDEHYYADTYQDLKTAFGYDREMLWNHYLTNGMKEGREMNRLINVAKYKSAYPDLAGAFGDDWDA